MQFRSTLLDPAKFAVGGPQADIGGKSWNSWGSLYGEKFSKDGKVGSGGYMMKQADMKKLNVKPDDFNDYSIKVVGKKVTIKVNGVTSVDEEYPNLPDEGIIAIADSRRLSDDGSDFQGH